MKKTFYYILALSLLASCKKDFMLTDNTEVNTGAFWKTASDASQGVNAIYSTYHRDALGRNHYFLTILRADEGYSTSPNADIINVYDAFNITDYTDYLVTGVYQDDYIGINRCNQVLENVPNINMDADLKKQYIGEAYFFRGFFYYD